MKRFVSVLLCLVLVLGLLPLLTLPARAYTSGEWEYTVTDGKATIQKYANNNHYMNVVVPDTLNGCPVTEIGNFTFYGNTDMTSVEIPACVTGIDIAAFEYCSSLSFIKFLGEPQLKTIGQRAFSGCSALKLLSIPNTVTEIGWQAFSGCTNLEDITIPESVTSIGGNAFSGCNGIEWVHYAGSYTRLTEIVNQTGNEPLLTARTIYGKGTVAATGSCGAEGSNVRWSFVDLGSNEYDMHIEGEGRMGNYTGYVDLPWSGFLGHIVSIRIGAGVTSIGANTFTSFGKDLTEVQFSGSTVTEIGENAFRGCSSLTEIQLPTSLSVIGQYAFEGCSGLKSIAIPAGVTAIGKMAFANCVSLTRVDITDLTAWCAIDFGEVSNPLAFGRRLYLNGTEIKDLMIPYGVTKIKPHAFTSATGLTSVTFPVGVTEIGEYAFCECDYLKTVTIPDSVTSIENDAFDSCPIKDVYYGGTEAQWEGISIGDDNGTLKSTAIIHYSSPMPLAIVGISADKTSAEAGNTITWTAEAVGGTAPLKYCFYIYQDGTVVQNTGYGTASTVSYTPTAAGTYKAKVFVKDSAGKSVSRVSANTAVTAAAVTPPSITEITADKTSAAAGEKITWTAAVTGGTAPLKYCFYN